MNGILIHDGVNEDALEENIEKIKELESEDGLGNDEVGVTDEVREEG